MRVYAEASLRSEVCSLVRPRISRMHGYRPPSDRTLAASLRRNSSGQHGIPRQTMCLLRRSILRITDSELKPRLIGDHGVGRAIAMSGLTGGCSTLRHQRNSRTRSSSRVTPQRPSRISFCQMSSRPDTTGQLRSSAAPRIMAKSLREESQSKQTFSITANSSTNTRRTSPAGLSLASQSTSKYPVAARTLRLRPTIVLGLK